MYIAYVADVILIFIFIGGLSVANLEDGEVRVDEGGNLTLPCVEAFETEVEDYQVYWVHEGRAIDATVLDNDSLFLEHMRREDAGSYKCIEVDTDRTLRQIKVLVRTPPPRLVNVTVHASTILALLRWDVADTGGYPISHYTAQYRLKHSSPDEPPDEWHKVIPGRISPVASQIDVYKLEPNSTYLFEVWASNQLGEGEVVQVEGTTHHDSEEIELGRHLLEGVETFDTRYWVAAVAVVMGTLVVLALGTCYALYRECHLPLMMQVLWIGVVICSQIVD
ncbi:protein turtle homolog A isoform X2 [Macrosteles quadrilineatus]|uniref:protein turtle homolog A isoform X2 n=1 Tax=Macrosteles quadrilineatus TaxID=74068 RepID=UPI0023E28566|nr:protein turtle homolog A isoform X2 [Macrosteles quadrilineatus]